jgi:hypothetical protein
LPSVGNNNTSGTGVVDTGGKFSTSLVDTFPTPNVSHWSLPLRSFNQLEYSIKG